MYSSTNVFFMPSDAVKGLSHSCSFNCNLMQNTHTVVAICNTLWENCASSHSVSIGFNIDIACAKMFLLKNTPKF